MYICICKGITDKQLEEAQKTTKSFRELCSTLGLGSECGTCVMDAIQTLQKSESKES